jgi:hypothetical protein
METLVLDGKTFVRASKAARDLGYTSDYVGQLCRSGQVSAHLVGRTWYVDQTELSGHRVEKKRMSRVKAREQAKKSIEEHARIRKEREVDTQKVVSVRYEDDASDLIPHVRKLAIEHEPVAPIHTPTKAEIIEEKAEPQYEVQNVGEKIVMSGKLKLIDLNEENLIDRETTHLTARINRKKISKTTEERAHAPLINNELYTPETPIPDAVDEVDPEIEPEIENGVTEKKNFLTRLSDYDALPTESVEENDIATETGATTTTSSIIHSTSVPVGAVQGMLPPQKGLLSVVFGILVPLFIFGGMLVLERNWEYTHIPGEDVVPTKSFLINYTDLIQFIRSKI